MGAIYQGGGESLSIAIVKGEEINPLRKGVNDCKAFIVAGKSLGLTLIVHCIARSWAIVGVRFEHATGLSSARLF